MDGGRGKVGPINLFWRVNSHGHVSLPRAHEQTLSWECRCGRDLLDNLETRRKVVGCQVDDHAVLATKVNRSIIPAERGKNKKKKRKKAGGEIPWRFRHRDTELCPPQQTDGEACEIR